MFSRFTLHFRTQVPEKEKRGLFRMKHLARTSLDLGFLKKQVFLMSFAISFFIGPLSEAKVFRNAYLSFEMPDRWDCTLEQTEWVCRTNAPGVESREAIIILTAKEVGVSDSLPAYEEHLKRPRTIANRAGQPLQSQILKVEQRQINNHPWVDGMHMSSEVPNYYTRYLATTKDKIGILVTFSAHKTHYTKYSADFFRAIASLRVIATKNLMGGSGSGAVLPGGDTFGASHSSAYSADDMGVLPDELDAGSGSGKAGTFLSLALILGAIGIYLFLKNRRRKH
jgi:hypothetical protein